MMLNEPNAWDRPPDRQLSPRIARMQGRRQTILKQPARILRRSSGPKHINGRFERLGVHDRSSRHAGPRAKPQEAEAGAVE
jgi:hypothetical protein